MQGMQGMQGGVKPAEVFSQFQGNLKSKAALKAFFEAEKIIAVLAPERNAKSSEHSVFKEFKESFHFNADKKDKRIFSVGFDWSDQEQIADLLNRYIETVVVQTKLDIKGRVKGDLLQKKVNLEQAIVSKRAMTAQRRSDEIVRLEESLTIAKSLSIEDYSGSSVVTNVSIKEGLLELGSNYNLGSKALAAQVAALKNRKTDDPYITGIRGLQEQLVLINNQLLAVSDDFKVVRIDQKAYRPDFSNKPNRRLIVASGGVLGLMLGVLAAFFFNFLENNRKEEGAEA